MAVAGLGAEGITEITDVEHIDRGYENIEKSIDLYGRKNYKSLKRNVK